MYPLSVILKILFSPSFDLLPATGGTYVQTCANGVTKIMVLKADPFDLASVITHHLFTAVYM